MNMFILVLTYQKPINEVDMVLPTHKKFLEKFYNSGNFIASGKQNPRIGGVILCKSKDRSHIQSIIAEDPFYTNGIAKYDIIEFEVTKCSEDFKQVLLTMD